MKRINNYITATAIILVILLTATIYFITRNDSVSITNNDKIDITPTQIKQIESIGEWEFLSVSDEELVDTTRHGFFGDDKLVRIYYGKLSLGINLKNAPDNWLKMKGDSLTATLPPIILLDNNFIDEAKSKSFYEEGKWTEADRKALYSRAYEAMKKRGLSNANMQNARQNAIEQFTKLFYSLGYNKVSVK